MTDTPLIQITSSELLRDRSYLQIHNLVSIFVFKNISGFTKKVLVCAEWYIFNLDCFC